MLKCSQTYYEHTSSNKFLKRNKSPKLNILPSLICKAKRPLKMATFFPHFPIFYSAQSYFILNICVDLSFFTELL